MPRERVPRFRFDAQHAPTRGARGSLNVACRPRNGVAGWCLRDDAVGGQCLVRGMIQYVPVSQFRQLRGRERLPYKVRGLLPLSDFIATVQ